MYLAEIKMDTEVFDMKLLSFLKPRNKSIQNVKKEQRFWIMKIFEKCFFRCTFFDFCQTGKDIS